MWKSVAVFCGSKFGNNNLFAQHAEQVGLLLAQKNIQLVYGGGRKGLMGMVANSAIKNNGKVVGVIPALLNEKEDIHTELETLHIVETMHERKKKMFELCEAAIILPGGFGTLDELFEMITWNNLSIHDKAIILLNSDGYYNNLLAHLERMQQEGFLYLPWQESFFTISGPNELVSLMA
ncbi:TIGR00730 family Rossman fold protein [Parafilimonas sp.]|uniref:LOG family protein n=1 Tax=Parafilimonas sp. TaxID=1969739 RepID=UPI0039E5E645